MPIRLLVARTSAEKDQVFRLRHQVFVEEEHRFRHDQDRLFDRYDCLNETLNLLALDGEVPVAAIRVTLDNPVGLPCCEHYDFGPVTADLQGQVASVGWLCCRQSHRQHPGLIVGLFKLSVRKMRLCHNRHIIATIHPPILPLLVNFGARAVGEVFEADALGVPMQAIYWDLDQLGSGVRETFEDPLNPVLDEADERRIYKRDELIVRRGESGDAAFCVMRGSVRVVLDGSGDAPAPNGGGAPDEPQLDERGRPLNLLFGQGQIFGELSLLDGGPRTSTVVAHSREADVMVWSQRDFLQQIQSHPDRTLALCQVLASRLRRNIERTIVAPPSALLGRILLDASRQGTQTVNADWLSRQCGIWIHDLETIVADWAQHGWILREGAHVRILQVAPLEAVSPL